MAIDIDQIQGLIAALADKRSLTTPIPMEDVEGLIAALSSVTPNLSRGAIQGLYLSNTIGNLATHLTISEGQCRDAFNSSDIVLPSGLVKNIAAPWAQGTGNGLRSTPAAIIANSWYHVFIIYNPTTGIVDAVGDQSAINPTVPSGFTKRRRIGSVLTDGSGNIWQFRQKPDRTIFKLPRGAEFINLTNQSTSGTLRQFHLPRGIKIRPTIVYQSVSSNVGSWWSGLYDPDDLPPTFGVNTQWGHMRRQTIQVGTAGVVQNYEVELVDNVWTDTNASLYSAGTDTTAEAFALGSLAWYDPLEWGM